MNLGPIVQDSGIEVSAIRPDRRTRLRVQARLAEHDWISEGSVQLAGKHRPKVDDLLRLVVEDNSNGVDTDMSKARTR
jgi:hypothetical protein